MKILFLIRSLNRGGAERQLVVLAKGLRERGHDVVVAVFYSGGELEKELLNAGVRIRPLNKRGRWDVFHFLHQLIRVMREERPNLLHGYLEDPNVMAVILKPFFPKVRIVWGVRNSSTDLKGCDWLGRLSFNLSRWLSQFADTIIVNSHVGRECHVKSGYPSARMVTIPNGIDAERFRPDLEAGRRLRGEWNVKDHETLIGLVGRLDVRKDHPVFLGAATLLAKQWKNTRFVCVGGGPADYRIRLQTLANQLGLQERVLWVGVRQDMPAVYNALDIAVSSSCTEGLPNAIGEAMACGVPCVVTDVGDSAWVVGGTGEVVPLKNPVALANAIERMLGRKTYDPARIRKRVVDQLSVTSLVTNTEQVLNALLKGSTSRVSSLGGRKHATSI